MSKLDQLYRDYFQRSRVFLYPALEIKKGVSVTPQQTYVSWDKIKPGDRKLICLYYLRDDVDFKNFERLKLRGNKLFHKFMEVEGSTDPKKGYQAQGVYIFNFDTYDKDWDHFLKGRYSKMSPVLKKKIKDFFRPTDNYAYVESFLHPEKYYALYSEILGVSVDTLKDVAELTDPPDMEKEALRIKLKQLTQIKT